MRIAVGVGAAAVAAAKQPGDLDPRHHHRGGGDGAGGGAGGGAQQQADEHRLLHLHQQAEAPSVPVFQLQHLQAAVRSSAEYALLAPMGDAGQHHHHHHHGGGFQPQLLSFGGGGVGLQQFTAQAPPSAAASRSRAGGGGEIVPSRAGGLRSGGGGEIVAVQGGHIVRSTGRKDRHSKVCTARGPRDRRVRLSAHTAIQFYDVQDRLGYDRPSKAVDWLIKNAKDAIDKLQVLPAWQPTSTSANPSSSTPHPACDDSADNSADDQAQAITVAQPGFDVFPATGAPATGTGGFLPSSLDSDSIADTIKSFFPMGGTGGGGEASSSTAAPQSSAMGGFHSGYTPDLLSRTGSHSQELRLSLQSLPTDPNPMFQHHQPQEHDRSHNGFPGYSFGTGAMWPAEQQSHHHHRMLPWNVPDPGGGGGGYLFNVSQQLGGQSQQFLFHQRGPLQSSNNNQPTSDRGWPDAVEADSNNPIFAPGFSGFRIPARIQGDEDHNAGGGGNGDKPPPPPSVSSASHH